MSARTQLLHERAVYIAHGRRLGSMPRWDATANAICRICKAPSAHHCRMCGAHVCHTHGSTLVPLSQGTVLHVSASSMNDVGKQVRLVPGQPREIVAREMLCNLLPAALTASASPVGTRLCDLCALYRRLLNDPANADFVPPQGALASAIAGEIPLLRYDALRLLAATCVEERGVLAAFLLGRFDALQHAFVDHAYDLWDRAVLWANCDMFGSHSRWLLAFLRSLTPADLEDAMLRLRINDLLLAATKPIVQGGANVRQHCADTFECDGATCHAYLRVYDALELLRFREPNPHPRSRLAFGRSAQTHLIYGDGGSSAMTLSVPFVLRVLATELVETRRVSGLTDSILCEIARTEPALRATVASTLLLLQHENPELTAMLAKLWSDTLGESVQDKLLHNVVRFAHVLRVDPPIRADDCAPATLDRLARQARSSVRQRLAELPNPFPLVLPWDACQRPIVGVDWSQLRVLFSARCPLLLTCIEDVAPHGPRPSVPAHELQAAADEGDGGFELISPRAAGQAQAADSAPGADLGTAPQLLRPAAHRLIFKAGDDVRRDELVIAVIRVMDTLLKTAYRRDVGLETYSVFATGPSEGFIQCVDDAQTLARVISQHGTLLRYFASLHPDSQDAAAGMQATSVDTRLLGRFVTSSAAWCAATYVLGITDRHANNIMIRTDGAVFHIDFSNILGEERNAAYDDTDVPLDPFSVRLLGDENSPEARDFMDQAVELFAILRMHASLLHAMLCVAPHLDPERIVAELRRRLHLGLDAVEACELFRAALGASYRQKMAQALADENPSLLRSVRAGAASSFAALASGVAAGVGASAHYLATSLARGLDR